MTTSHDSVTAAPQPRWPRVLGTLGIVLAVIILIDQIDDLAILGWTDEDWERIFAPDIAEVITSALPSVGWRMFSVAAQSGLAVLLLLGSVGVRRRRRSGIYQCRLWAWLAIIWAVITVGWAIWWLPQYASEFPALSRVNWQGYAVFGISVALILMLTFPVFQLVWFSRPNVKTEYESWSRE